MRSDTVDCGLGGVPAGGPRSDRLRPVPGLFCVVLLLAALPIVLAGAARANQPAGPPSAAHPSAGTAANAPCAPWQTGQPGNCVDLPFRCDGGEKEIGLCRCPEGFKAVSLGGRDVRCDAPQAARVIKCTGGTVDGNVCLCGTGLAVYGAAPDFSCVPAKKRLTTCAEGKALKDGKCK